MNLDSMSLRYEKIPSAYSGQRRNWVPMRSSSRRGSPSVGTQRGDIMDTSDLRGVQDSSVVSGSRRRCEVAGSDTRSVCRGGLFENLR